MGAFVPGSSAVAEMEVTARVAIQETPRGLPFQPFVFNIRQEIVVFGILPSELTPSAVHFHDPLRTDHFQPATLHFHPSIVDCCPVFLLVDDVVELLAQQGHGMHLDIFVDMSKEYHRIRVGK